MIPSNLALGRTFLWPSITDALAQLFRHCAQAERSRVRFSMVSLGFFIDLILSALGSTQPLTKVSTGNISWG